MKKDKTLQEWLSSEIEDMKDDPEFILEGVILELTEQIYTEMENQGLSKSELARRSDMKPAAITRFFRGQENLTFATAVKLGAALGVELHVFYKPISREQEDKDKDKVVPNIDLYDKVFHI